MPVSLTTIPEIERVIQEASAQELPGLLGELERLRALAWQRMTAPRGDGSADIGMLTTARLAELWGMPAAKIRELCRAGRIPARKLGKEWVVPVAALREWARRNPLEQAVVSRYNDSHEAHRGQGAAPQARPHRVEVRRPPGRAPGHGPKVGDGGPDHQPDGRAPDAATGGA
jgi:excisionase family DNA binding protein